MDEVGGSDEIASIIGVPVGTVKSRISRGVPTLKPQLRMEGVTEWMT